MEFKLGDKVKHKLTGEAMLVVQAGKGPYRIYCRRFDGTKYEIVRFEPEELKPA